jgi:hypothetical protein
MNPNFVFVKACMSKLYKEVEKFLVHLVKAELLTV